jgi:hypothetical protein
MFLVVGLVLSVITFLLCIIVLILSNNIKSTIMKGILKYLIVISSVISFSVFLMDLILFICIITNTQILHNIAT